MRVTLLTLLIVAGPEGAGDPGKLSRPMILERAAKNAKVRAAEARVEGARAQLDQADAAQLPMITMRLTVSTAQQARLVEDNGVRSERSAYDTAVDELSASFGGRLEVLQVLHTFGKIDARQAAAGHGISARRAQAEMSRAEVALEAADLYEAHLFARSVERFMEDVLTILDQSIRDTKDRLEAGTYDASQQDLLRLQAAEGFAKLVRNRAEAGLRQTEAGLRLYLDLKRSAPVTPADDQLEPLETEPLQLQPLLSLASQNRPELTALSEGRAAFEKLAEAEHAGYYPDLFLLGFVSGAYTPGRDFVTSRYVFDPQGHFVPGLVVGARWQIWWDMAGARADEVQADADRLANLKVWADSGIAAEVERHFQDVTREQEDLELLRESVPITKQWTVRASADYATGLGDSRELIDAVEAYLLMRTKELESTYGLNRSLAALAKATGTLVSGQKGEVYP